ncbi:MAG: YidC/Oxa1 family insertase periplasmic-domain containing protein [Bacteroidia bacterium]|nr:YidC/Oxa1 family insertase periplasmic-domain containing protein [Bacteroidia bacterium]MDW8134859.1 YidC/Oxa1 family insertase periplasmic-domain containing protein [Bacteroidia bacterium]
MSQQSWIGIFLITLLMFLWVLWIGYTSMPSATSDTPPKTQDTTHSRLPLSRSGILVQPNSPLDSAARVARYGPYAPYTLGKDSLFTVETAVAKWTFGTRGARLHKQELKLFSTPKGTPVTLWDSTQRESFTFAEGRNILSSEELFFTLIHAPDKPLIHLSDSVVFRVSFSPDTFLQVTYRLHPSVYRIEREIKFQGLAGRLRNPYLLHTITYHTPQTESSTELVKPYCALYYRQADEVEMISPDEEESIQKALQGRIRWVSAKGQFFCALFQGEQAFSAANLTAFPFTNLPAYQVQLQLPLTGEVARETWYLGPTRYTLLRSYDEMYERQLELGWGFIRYINTAFIIPCFALLEKFIDSYGIIISILAILVKIVLSPLTWRSYLLGVRMQVVNELPEVKALEEKYKDQPDKLMLEKSLLYRQLGINPLSGCVPLLLQIPIFFAMTSFFPNAFELRQQRFLWANDLSSYDALIKWGLEIPLIGDHISLFALLTTLSMVAYAHFTQQNQTTAYPALKWLPYLTPFIFFLFLNEYSAALSWYYFVLNMLTIVQIGVMKRFTNKEKLIQKLREIQRRKPNKAALAQQRERLRKWFKK